MRILYVDEAFGFGGSTTCLGTVVRHIDRTRFDPVVVLSYRDPLGQIVHRHFADIPVIMMSRPYVSLSSSGPAMLRKRFAVAGWAGDKVFVAAVTTYNLFADFIPRIWRLFRILRRLRIDLLHANNAFSLNQASILASILAGVPFVCHVRGFEKVTKFGRRLFQRAEAVVVQSYSQQEDLVRQGLKREKINVVHEGLAVSELWSEKNIPILRCDMGVSADTPLYGIVGMLVPWKGHRIFLDAAALVAKAIPNARAVIIGDTITREDGYGEELRKLADQLGLGQHVLFSGFCTNAEAAYGELDVVVHSSVEAEPFGRVLIEGMARGKPVVATRGGGPDEIVLDGETGILVPRGNAKALAEAIIRLLHNPDLRVAMGKAGLERVRTHFVATRQTRTMEQIYAQLDRVSA